MHYIDYIPIHHVMHVECGNKAVLLIYSARRCLDLPKAISRLLRNPVFVFVLAGCCFNSYLIGFFTFLPKYLETYFGYSASFASVLTGTYLCC